MWQTKPALPDEVFRWFKHGDHHRVEPINFISDADKYKKCDCCGKPMIDHGFMEQTVCPGNWIVVMPGYYVSVYTEKQFHDKFEDGTFTLYQILRNPMDSL
jgi:hypothetical protein